MKHFLLGILALGSCSTFAATAVLSNLQISPETEEVLLLKGYNSLRTFDGVLEGNSFLKGEAGDLVITLEASYDKKSSVCSKVLNLSKAIAPFSVRISGSPANPVTGLSMAPFISRASVYSIEQKSGDNKRKCNNQNSFRNLLLELPNAGNQ